MLLGRSFTDAYPSPPRPLSCATTSDNPSAISTPCHATRPSSSALSRINLVLRSGCYAGFENSFESSSSAAILPVADFTG
ncbi:hypothetical protein NL676_009864 [Syzygium grande]|nr:hypothetical protein NL676_009864 [Syzygium grande]